MNTLTLEELRVYLGMFWSFLVGFGFTLGVLSTVLTIIELIKFWWRNPNLGRGRRFKMSKKPSLPWLNNVIKRVVERTKRKKKEECHDHGHDHGHDHHDHGHHGHGSNLAVAIKLTITKE